MSGVQPGDVAHYSCDPGYQISGNTRRECQDDGTWSGDEPRCVQQVGKVEGFYLFKKRFVFFAQNCF